MHGMNTMSITERALKQIGRSGTFEHDFKGVDVPVRAGAGGSWFAVAVYNNRKASDEITDLGFPIFGPMQRIFKRRRGRKVQTESPLFPGYLFARFDRDRDEWGAIDHVDNVLGILRNGESPVKIPDNAIESLKIAETMGVFDKTKPPKIGLEVEALDGPFAGWVGKIVRARSNERVEVLLGILGRMVSVELPLSSLRGVE